MTDEEHHARFIEAVRKLLKEAEEFMKDEEQSESRSIKGIIGDEGDLCWEQVYQYLKCLDMYNDYYLGPAMDRVIWYLERDLATRKVSNA